MRLKICLLKIVPTYLRTYGYTANFYKEYSDSQGNSAIFMGKTCKCRKKTLVFIGSKEIYSVPSDSQGIPVIFVGKTFAVYYVSGFKFLRSFHRARRNCEAKSIAF